MKSIKLNKIKMLGAFLLVSGFTFSQTVAETAADKRVQAGLTTNLGMNLLSLGTTRMQANGIGGNFSIGIIMHSAFKKSKNLGISTGIDFDFASQKYSTKVPTYYRYTDTDILKQEDAGTGSSVFSLTDRTQKSTYISVPLMLLFRTDFIGDFRYFGKFGIRNSFLVASKFNDYGQVNDNGSLGAMVENNNMKSPGEAFLYQGSVGLSAGAEWNFVGSTCLVLEAGYYYGVTPQYLERKDNKRTTFTTTDVTLQDPNKVYYSNKSTMSQVLFRISLLF